MLQGEVGSFPEARSFAMSPHLDLKRECKSFLQRYRVPAVGLARIGPGGVEALDCAGERKLGSGIAVTENDLWHIGSCTKSMTALLMARLVESGELEWDIPIAPMFEAAGAEVHPGFSRLTLRHLLNHRSGMPVDPPEEAILANFETREPLYELRARIAADALYRGPDHRPGEVFCYSNLSYVVAGAIAEGITGLGWEELMRREVFSPLGLASAGFGAPGREARGGMSRLFGREPVTQPWGHQVVSDDGMLGDLPPFDDRLADSAPMMGPAGTVHLSLPDFARYVAFHASGGTTVPGYLTAETVTEIHTPLPGEDYALGWFAMDAEASGIGHSLIWHEGSNNAWYAAMLIVPDVKRGWVFVCNAYREQLQDQASGVLIALGEGDEDRTTITA